MNPEPRSYPRLATFKTPAAFLDYVASLKVSLPFDPEMKSGPASPLGQPLTVDGQPIGNRFCVLPMEGWDGTRDGAPTELTERRWRRFGEGGAKRIWRGEALAVRHDGRANPNQLCLTEATMKSIGGLRETLVRAHAEKHGKTDDLLVGLQITHSGRFARPNDHGRIEPKIAYRHPLLATKYKLPDDQPVLTDDEIRVLIDDFVRAAVRARKLGYHFVDVKHCHGYLGHEFLSAVDRPGSFGGSLENRTRFLREIVAGIHSEAPGLRVGVRVSIFDIPPYATSPGVTGTPMAHPTPYRYAFGGSPDRPFEIDLAEPVRFLEMLGSLGIRLICTSAGSPYYNPHIQRPALFPPSDGYLPPEDPLVGVARQIAATGELKAKFPDLAITGSAYSYLQEYLPNVGQAVVREGKADFIGLGRVVLSYPELPADVLAGRPLQRKLICRTFSDCTTAPRNGMVSGCYPLDDFYGDRPEAAKVKTIKSGLRHTS